MFRFQLPSRPRTLLYIHTFIGTFAEVTLFVLLLLYAKGIDDVDICFMNEMEKVWGTTAQFRLFYLALVLHSKIFCTIYTV